MNLNTTDPPMMVKTITLALISAIIDQRESQPKVTAILTATTIKGM